MINPQDLTQEQRAEIERQIETCKTLQHEFWDKLRDLEALLDCEVSSHQDLDSVTLEDLLELSVSEEG